MSGLQLLMIALGRMCFSLIFILGGIEKISNWEMTEQAVSTAFTDLFNYSVNYPWVQNLIQDLMPHVSQLVLGATILELGGGILLFFGLQVRLAAVLLLIFLSGATFLLHPFWRFEGPERELQMIMFLKNFALFGATLMLVGYGKGGAKKQASIGE